MVGGYGFLAVFVCAMTFRSAERSHDYHAAMHEVTERLERLLTLFVLLVLGIGLSRGLLPSWALVPGLAFWLLFLPNAPYIITDLFHVRTVSEQTLFFDTIMLFLFALTGLLTGLYSQL